MTPRPRRIAARREETPGVVTLDLARDAASPPPEPGTFAMLYAFGVGESAISVSGRAPDGGERHTIRAVGDVTRALCSLGPGDSLGWRGPFGRGWPLDAETGRRLIMVAGGLGLAPLRPAVEAALTGASAYAGVHLVVGARAPEDVLYPDDLQAWRLRGLDVSVTVDRAGPGWTGRVGVVTHPLTELLRRIDPGAASAFLCGPEVMMRFAAQALSEAGTPDARIHLSLERSMKCALGHCGRCQLGPDFICRDGPVLPYDRLSARLAMREL